MIEVNNSEHNTTERFFTFEDSNYLTTALFGSIITGIVLNAIMNFDLYGWNVVIIRDIIFLAIVSGSVVFYYLNIINLSTVLISSVYTILLGFIAILPLVIGIEEFDFISYFLELQVLTLIFGFLLTAIVKPYHDLIIGAFNLIVTTSFLIVIIEFKFETYLFYVIIVSAKCIIAYLIFSKVLILRKNMKVINKTIINQNTELLELTNFRKDIIKVIAHDLRNPIQQISSLLDLLSYSETENERSEIMGFVNKSVTNAYDMLEELLKWAMQNDSSLKDLSKFDMKEVIDAIENQLAEQINQKKLDIIKVIGPHSEVIYSKNVIETVTRNLLINAIKFSPVKDRIRISFESSKTSFSLKVFNNAKVIEFDNIENFNAGHKQLKSTTGTANEKGSGNGLSVCRQMLNKNNADLTLKAEQNGVLATVLVNKVL